MVIAGTRPEVIKLAPLVHRMRHASCPLDVRFCLSGQHRELLDRVLCDLDVEPDLRLEPPSHASLTAGLATLLGALGEAMDGLAPQGVVVQGDTNTTLAAAMAAFHRRTPVFHVEAGLRTPSIDEPFPEEMNRRVVSRLASLHFAPTPTAVHNLLAEGVPAESILLTGNTGADALRLYGRSVSRDAEAMIARLRPACRTLLVTLHRRENGRLAQAVVQAVEEIVHQRPDVQVIWVLHANGIRTQVSKALRGCPSVLLTEALSYAGFVQLMRRADIILTDSGGVQEEAPSLGKPVLILRKVTERGEAVEAGNGWMVGCERERVCSAVSELLDDPILYARRARPHHAFGDGFAAERIVDALEAFFGVQRRSASA